MILICCMTLLLSITLRTLSPKMHQIESDLRGSSHGYGSNMKKKGTKNVVWIVSNHWIWDERKSSNHTSKKKSCVPRPRTTESTWNLENYSNWKYIKDTILHVISQLNICRRQTNVNTWNECHDPVFKSCSFLCWSVYPFMATLWDIKRPLTMVYPGRCNFPTATDANQSPESTPSYNLVVWLRSRINLILSGHNVYTNSEKKTAEAHIPEDSNNISYIKKSWFLHTQRTQSISTIPPRHKNRKHRL